MDAWPFYEYSHVVCFEDTNIAGNVYYAAYVSWQGRAREMFLKEHAPQIVDDLNGGMILATLNVSCEYHHELKVFDEVSIRLRLASLVGSRMKLRFEYWKVNCTDPLLVAQGEQKIGCLRRNNETVVAESIPTYLCAALTPYQPPRPPFAKRIEQIPFSVSTSVQ